mmetsp:Transcript_26558/g.64494  ORF Transcript_26558/g.64494 Transcript_26558/m.64494 type:complete len:84 (+) Transcript_26558:1408-1659(+)
MLGDLVSSDAERSRAPFTVATWVESLVDVQVEKMVKGYARTQRVVRDDTRHQQGNAAARQTDRQANNGEQNPKSSTAGVKEDT